jgi:ribosome recycling factor
MATVKTGRAKPSLIESVTVEAYGTNMKLVELASISAPDPTLLVVQPWDKGNLQAIEKGLQIANLGLNPVVDNDQIRLAIPSLTQERREEMVKLVKQKLETGKQMLRDVRQKYKKLIDGQKGQPGVSEDLITTELDQLQTQMDKFTEKLDQLAADKEKELMQVS